MLRCENLPFCCRRKVCTLWRFTTINMGGFLWLFKLIAMSPLCENHQPVEVNADSLTQPSLSLQESRFLSARLTFQWWISPNACFYPMFEQSHNVFFIREHDSNTVLSFSNIRRRSSLLLLIPNTEKVAQHSPAKLV